MPEQQIFVGRACFIGYLLLGKAFEEWMGTISHLLLSLDPQGFNLVKNIMYNIRSVGRARFAVHHASLLFLRIGRGLSKTDSSISRQSRCSFTPGTTPFPSYTISWKEKSTTCV